MKHTNLLLSLPLATLLFTGCGDDSGTTDENSTIITDENETEAVPETQMISISGKVIDGYISGADVFIDLNENYELDSDEPSSTTSEVGDFSISSDLENGEYKVVSVGGTDVLTDTTFENTLYTIVTVESEDLENVYLSPLSTIVTESYLTNKSTSSLEEIKAIFTTEMNLSSETDILNTDFVETALNGDTSLFIANQEVLSAINILSNDISYTKDDIKPERVAIETIVKTSSFDRATNLQELGIQSSYIDGIAVESETAQDPVNDVTIPEPLPEEMTQEELLEFLKDTQDQYYSDILVEKDRSEEVFDNIDQPIPDGETESSDIEPILPYEITLLRDSTEATFTEFLNNASENSGDIEIELSSVYDLENYKFVDAELLQMLESEEIINDELNKSLTSISTHLEYAGSELDNFMETIELELNSTISERLEPIIQLQSSASNAADFLSLTGTMSNGDYLEISLGENEVNFDISNENGTDLKITFSLDIDETGAITTNANDFKLSGTLVGENYRADNIIYLESETNNSIIIESFSFDKDENYLSLTNIEIIEDNLVSISGEATTSTFSMNGTISEVAEGQIAVSGEINFVNELSISGNAEIIMSSSGGTPPSVPETMRITKSETMEAVAVSFSESNFTEIVTTMDGNLSEIYEVATDEIMENQIIPIDEVTDEMLENGVIVEVEEVEETLLDSMFESEILSISVNGKISTPDGRTIEGDLNINDQMIYFSNVSFKSEDLSINAEKIEVQNFGVVSEITSCETVIYPDNETEEPLPPMIPENEEPLPPMIPESDETISETEEIGETESVDEVVSEIDDDLVADNMGDMPPALPTENPFLEENETQESTEENLIEEQPALNTDYDAPPSIPQMMSIQNLVTAQVSATASEHEVYTTNESCKTTKEEISSSLTITGLTSSLTVENGVVEFARDIVIQENETMISTGKTVFGETTIESNAMSYGNIKTHNSTVSAGNMTGMTVETFNDGDVIYSKIVTQTNQTFYLKSDGSVLTVLDENGNKLIKNLE